MSNKFRYAPFSVKQKWVLTWWTDESPYKDKDGIICDGAVRSGKTIIMGLSYVIWATSSFDGEQFGMAGKTIMSLRRNLIKPLLPLLLMRGYEYEEHRQENYITIRGFDKDGNQTQNDFYLFGGKDEASQDLIQGITLAGIFLDEVALMPESFVNQATTRCSVEGSKLWFNCNPESPDHYFKLEWIDLITEKNLIRIHFTMDDNPSLSDEIKDRYKRMYKGVFFDRYILGLWCVASGLIFPYFAENNEPFLVTDEDCKAQQYSKRVMGIDFGGTGSKTVFHLTGYIGGYAEFRSLDEDSIPLGDEIGAKEICDKFVEFYRRCIKEWGRVDWIFPDSASPTMINSLIASARDAGLPYRNISGCRKNEVCERPKTFDSLLNTGRYKINKDRCTGTIKALGSLRWDEKHSDIPEDKNIGNVNDYWDALNYTVLDFIEYIDLYKRR